MRTLAAVAVLVWLAGGTAHAAPPGLITKCADVTYRQTHLSQCNLGAGPGFGVGGGTGGGGGGLLGAIGDLLGGLF